MPKTFGMSFYGYNKNEVNEFINNVTNEYESMLEKLKKIIAEQLNVNEAEIKPETKFKDDLGADSLDLFEMVMALEEEFGIEIPSEDLENIVTVNDIIGYLKEKGVEA